MQGLTEIRCNALMDLPHYNTSPRSPRNGAWRSMVSPFPHRIDIQHDTAVEVVALPKQTSRFRKWDGQSREEPWRKCCPEAGELEWHAVTQTVRKSLHFQHAPQHIITGCSTAESTVRCLIIDWVDVLERVIEPFDVFVREQETTLTPTASSHKVAINSTTYSLQ